jgi:uncharacterized membrane protein HdeD (DUF308 family)
MLTTEPDDTVPGLAIAREWPALMTAGIITIILGAIVLAWPSETLVVVSVLLGIQFVVFGLFRLIEAFAGEAPGLVGFVGVLLMISGVIVLRNPYETVAILATILGVVWVVSGSIDVVATFADRNANGRAMRILAGLVSIVAGVVIVSWPAPTVTVIAWVAGLQLVIFGLLIVAAAFSFRTLVDD